ncbi:intraflagellar transport-associated protein isoform X2 [Taeniopygia guttata]|uniref:intraflagellar transport-associated protein isoform X2 n=1 Tax=Taeniopygia guttata TaxID=59729 RepID=UPI003BB94269
MRLAPFPRNFGDFVHTMSCWHAEPTQGSAAAASRGGRGRSHGSAARGLLGPVVLAGCPARPGLRLRVRAVGNRDRRARRAGGDGTTRNPPASRSFNSLLWKKLRVTAEKEGKTVQGSKVDSLRKKSFTSELPNRNKQNGSTERSKEMWVSFPPEMPNEKETVMSESSAAGVSDANNLSLSERVKVDKYLDLEDVDTDEETCNGSLVLPGEVEETVACCTPLFDKAIQPKFRAWSVPQPSDSKAQELLGDDVQPFSLDEEFDYDNVALTPKFSEAELKAIIELSKEKMGTDVKSAQAED